MLTFLLLVVLFLFALSLYIGAGVLIGMALHWIWPAIDLGIGALIGVVVLAQVLQFVARLWLYAPVLDEEIEPEEPPFKVIVPPAAMPGRRARKRRDGRQ